VTRADGFVATEAVETGHLPFHPINNAIWEDFTMIRKLKTGEYRLYSAKASPKTGKRRNLGTFRTREEAVQHEREVQYFKRRH